MDMLSPVNFPSESSPLPSPGIELTLFGYVTGSNQRLYPLCHVSLTKVTDKLNNIEPTIDFTYEQETNILPFSDILLINNNKLEFKFISNPLIKMIVYIFTCILTPN